MFLPTNLDGARLCFEVINAGHNVSDFHCENPYLTEFLTVDALVETQADVSRTHLLLDVRKEATKQIVGYFTLHADSIQVENEAEPGSFLYPLIYISALARDFQYKGKGVGDLLLIEAFRCAMQAAEIIGIAGIHLLATPQGDPLYKGYGFAAHPQGGGYRLIPIADVRAYLQATENVGGETT